MIEATEKLQILNRHHDSDGVFSVLYKKDFHKKDLRQLCRIYNLEIIYVIGGEE